MGRQTAPATSNACSPTQVVEMTDHPREALTAQEGFLHAPRPRPGQDAREANACVSAGNTGALMAMAHFVLKMLPGVERPAIVSLIPSRGGHTLHARLGANASCTPEQLVPVRRHGIGAWPQDLEGAHERPRVGLLNIGEEEIKGNETVQSAHNLIAGERRQLRGFRRGARYILGQGGRRGHRRLHGQCRPEDHGGRGAADHRHAARGVHPKHRTQARGACRGPEPRALRTRLDPRRYNGATMVGLNGIVIKSHGGADLFGFQRAIEVAVMEARNGVPAKNRATAGRSALTGHKGSPCTHASRAPAAICRKNIDQRRSRAAGRYQR
jgi:glycerol-3-phosphate acyltransferase PlsX